MAKWTLDLSQYADRTTKDMKKVRKAFAFALYSSIVQKTPKDTGRAQGNWNHHYPAPLAGSIAPPDGPLVERRLLNAGSDDDTHCGVRSIPDPGRTDEPRRPHAPSGDCHRHPVAVATHLSANVPATLPRSNEICTGVPLWLLANAVA